MTPEEIDKIRPRLLAFAEQMLGGLARTDQRAKGELYLRGLMTDGKRKSMQPMAQRLGVDHQQLQQFISSSTWDYTGIRTRLARWAAQAIAPSAYVIDDSAFPKDGSDSPGVARMYCGALGKRANCQVGVSLNLVTDRASSAVNWRLFIPASWDERGAEDQAVAQQIRRRRSRCQIPEEVRHREKWRLALDMLDEAREAWDLPDLPVTADSGYGDATGFRLGLEERGLSYAVAVKASTTAYPGDARPHVPAYGGRGRPPVSAYPQAHSTLREIALAAGRRAGRYVTWRHGSKKTPDNPTAALRSRFVALRVRPASREIPRGPDGSLPVCWLLAEWPPGAAEPSDYWLSNLPEGTALRELVRLAKIRWRVEHDYRELKDGLGLDHFEGRSFAGWHRHVTLAAVAQAFCTLLRLDPKVAAPV
jgi:SRSO17 transposase